MKEMVYQKEHTVVILDEGNYDNYHYLIVSYGHHPCAYVEIPKTHVLYNHCDKKSYFGWINSPLEDIDCHGGITYVSDTGYGKDERHRDGRWIGWDYAHAGDFAGYYNEEDGCLYDNKKWTTTEILGEVKYVIRQLKELNR